MLSLLHIIDNPQQDIPLASVLRSPIVGLTEDELAQIRLEKPDGLFYGALLAAAEADPLEESEKGFQLRSWSWIFSQRTLYLHLTLVIEMTGIRCLPDYVHFCVI